LTEAKEKNLKLGRAAVTHGGTNVVDIAKAVLPAVYQRLVPRPNDPDQRVDDHTLKSVAVEAFRLAEFVMEENLRIYDQKQIDYDKSGESILHDA
jgi:hypothetical protein